MIDSNFDPHHGFLVSPVLSATVQYLSIQILPPGSRKLSAVPILIVFRPVSIRLTNSIINGISLLKLHSQAQPLIQSP